MIYIFCIFAALLIYFSFRSFLGGIAYLDYFRGELARPASNYKPFVSVIAPCKGVDQGLEKNISAIFSQEFPEYEIVFAVDDPRDTAVSVIERVISRFETETSKVVSKIVVAPTAEGSSQKIENMIAAVAAADRRAEVFVFVDSDARVSPVWLSSLVGPLCDANVGAATGYRWFISQPMSISGELRSVWNASIASSLGRNTSSNFCWGGSTAISREIFDELDIVSKWRGTLSDDLVLTKAVKASGREIAFIPQALTASVSGCNFSELLEFTTRQLKITRVYAQYLWAASLIGSLLFCGVMLSAVLILSFSDLSPISQLAAAVTLISVSILSIGKAYLRRKAVLLVLPEYTYAIPAFSQLTLWAVTPFIFLYNCVAAFFSRQITWRGIKYRLVSDSQTEIVDIKP